MLFVNQTAVNRVRHRGLGLHDPARGDQCQVFPHLFTRVHRVSFDLGSLFGMVMIAVEFRVSLVMESFDFLGNLMGKGIFYI
jgi:hypothetical protein